VRAGFGAVAAGAVPALVTAPILVSMPAAAGVAILRYRLYDIDRIINRTLVYGLLTVLLGVVYAAGVFAAARLPDPADGESELAVAALDPGLGRPVPAGSPPHPGGRGPALQPPQVQRRQDR